MLLVYQHCDSAESGDMFFVTRTGLGFDLGSPAHFSCCPADWRLSGSWTCLLRGEVSGILPLLDPEVRPSAVPAPAPLFLGSDHLTSSHPEKRISRYWLLSLCSSSERAEGCWLHFSGNLQQMGGFVLLLLPFFQLFGKK